MRSTRSICRAGNGRCASRHARSTSRGEPSQPGARDAAAEPRGGRLLEPVRLVEDHRVVLGQHAAAGGDVREVERVVDDHEVGRGGPLAGRLGEARRDERAAPAGAAVGADGELGPEGLGRLERELGAVAGLGRVEPALHRLPGAGVAAVGEQEGLEALELAAAEVVRASLQHLDAHVAPDRRARRSARPSRGAAPAAPWSQSRRRRAAPTRAPGRGTQGSCRRRCPPPRRDARRLRARARRSRRAQPARASPRSRAAHARAPRRGRRRPPSRASLRERTDVPSAPAASRRKDAICGFRPGAS